MSYRRFGRRNYRRNNYRQKRNFQLFEEWLPFAFTPVEDTYTEEEIECPIPRGANQIPCIHGVEWQWEGGLIDDGDNMPFHISKRSKTAIGRYDDQDIIYLSDVLTELTTSGAFIYDKVQRYEFKYPIPIPNIKLYIAATANVGSVGGADISGRIKYTMRYVSRAEIMEALMD